MQIEDIRRQPTKVLTEDQREAYFTDGYLVLEEVISPEWLQRLRDATDEMLDKSRAVTESDDAFVLEPDHSAEDPKLRRLSNPVEQHPVYWEFATESPLPDIAADLVGPDVRFHHSKLNFKRARGGEEVQWHQDVQSWPHTNYSPLTMGTYLYDCTMEQGPLSVLPGSHDGPLYDFYGPEGEWLGQLSEEDRAQLDTSDVQYLPGPAGSVTIHNCRMVHSSLKNESELGRPLLLNVFSSADAIPYTPNPIPSRYAGAIVRGETPRWVHHDPRPCLLPPDWSGGYSVPFFGKM